MENFNFITSTKITTMVYMATDMMGMAEICLRYDARI